MQENMPLCLGESRARRNRIPHSVTNPLPFIRKGNDMRRGRSVYFNAVRCVAGALAISSLFLCSAAAQGSLVTLQDRAAAYRDAVKCFVVAGVFSGDYEAKHD